MMRGMTDLQKAIETVQDMLDVVDSHGSCYVYKHNGGDERLRNVLDCLRAQQEQENPAPLTLEELHQMDGEPVWIAEYPDWGHWELSTDAQDYIEDRDTDFYGMKHDDPDGRYGLHKLGWLAYRCRPKEADNEEI